MNGEFAMSNWIGANRCRTGGKNVWEKQEDVPPGWGVQKEIVATDGAPIDTDGILYFRVSSFRTLERGARRVGSGSGSNVGSPGGAS